MASLPPHYTPDLTVPVNVLRAAAAAAQEARLAPTAETISSKSLTTIPGTSRVTSTSNSVWGAPNAKTSLLLAAGLNAAVLAYVAFKLYRNATVQHEKYLQLKRSAQRLWRLATQGAEAAGPVPEDLGEPDASGVYTKQSLTGTLYFRQARQYPSGGTMWEWSSDRTFWIPACHADSLWYGSDSSPSQADKVLIRRLEVERQLLCRRGQGTQQGGSSGCGGGGGFTDVAAAQLPPLDLSQASRDLGCLADVPTAFLCPISMRLMTQPVVTPSGATFDRPAILDWIRQAHTDPLSGQPLSSDALVPNLVLRDMIHAWLHEGTGGGSSSSSSSSDGGDGGGDTQLGGKPRHGGSSGDGSSGDGSSSGKGGGSSRPDGAGLGEAAPGAPATPRCL